MLVEKEEDRNTWIAGENSHGKRTISGKWVNRAVAAVDEPTIAQRVLKSLSAQKTACLITLY